jgi:hypothetical protein
MDQFDTSGRDEEAVREGDVAEEDVREAKGAV